MGRRKTNRELRTAQVNLKVRPSFKAFLDKLANDRDMPLVALIEIAVIKEYRPDIAKRQPEPSPNWDWLVQ